jgi:hypothetical protein
MRNALFGEGKISDDMNFDWVNATNILGVYDQFVNTVGIKTIILAKIGMKSS